VNRGRLKVWFYGFGIVWWIKIKLVRRCLA